MTYHHRELAVHMPYKKLLLVVIIVVVTSGVEPIVFCSL